MNALRFYASLCSEVGDICGIADSNPDKKICILCDGHSNNFYSAISAELKYNGVEYDDLINCRQSVSVAALEIFRHWTSWQIDRDIFAFLKFYQDLVAHEICCFDDFKIVNKKVNPLLYRYLTPNYDIIFNALAKEISLQKFLNQYDLKNEKVSIVKFLSSLQRIFGDLLCKELLKKLDGTFASYDSTHCEKFEILAKVTEEFFKTHVIQQRPGKSANVAIANSRTAARDSYDLYLCSFTNCQNFNEFTEYVLAKKNCIITCVAKCWDDVPDLLRHKIFTATGQLLSLNDFQNFQIKRNCIESIYATDGNILQTKIAYDSRNSSQTKLNQYSYMLDLGSPHSIACKTVEILLKNPAGVFYDHVLKLENVHSRFDVETGEKIFLGSLVHELLNVAEHCQAVPTLEQFYSLIDGKWEVIWQEMTAAYGATSANANYFVLEIFRIAKYMAYKFAEKIVSLGYKFIATEVKVPICTILGEKLGDFKLTGRVDCILSEENFTTNPQATINIFDFKSSKYDALNPEKLSSQIAEYTGVQVCMYGLAYRSAGFERVNVQILRHDCENILPISLEALLGESQSLFAELAGIFRSGIIGEKPVKFAMDTTNLPLAAAVSMR
ncbi:MAG: PD-(D/E)XK nuclease family protein [Puniceicoccales bacterium]|jgi:hypothetical protein|nr:PD-(D/E)XK nuclease family protein [Puniceicoccales bacterium]